MSVKKPGKCQAVLESTDQMVVLKLLKDSSTGIKPKELCKSARELLVAKPLTIVRELIDGGYVRLDKGKNFTPDLLKALPPAWSIENV